MFKKFNSVITTLVAALVLTSCSILPNSGPYSGSFSTSAYDYVQATPTTDNAGELLGQYVLVDIDSQVTKILERRPYKPFDGRFTGRRNPADIRVGVGDTVRVTIFEAGSGGLFIPTGSTLSNGNFVNIPDQQVDQSGQIKVPYAGLIKVVGKRPSRIAAQIEDIFAGLTRIDVGSKKGNFNPTGSTALDPRVIVTLPDRTSNLITVLGDVNEAGRFNITLGGERVLDAIGLAKGAKFQDYETLVTLQRGIRKATVRLSSLTQNPRNDTFLFPRDVVYVKRDQRFFTVVGATNSNGQVPFDRESLSIADALAKSGGLEDGRSDPQTIVLYRSEAGSTLRKMGAKTPEQYKNLVPTIYRLNLRKPSGFFLAQNFKLRDNDLIYVSNAPFVEWVKVLSAINANSLTTITGRGALLAVGVTN